MKEPLFLVVCSLLAVLCAHAQDIEKTQPAPETWADEGANTYLMLYRLPKAGSPKEVRDQAAGFMEGPIHTGQFLPRSMGNLTFAGLPALYMRGTLYGQDAEQEILYLLLFSEEFSAIAIALAPRAPEAKSVRDHLGPSVKPLLISKAIIEEVGPKLQEDISELQVMAKKLIDQKRAVQASQPTPRSGVAEP